MSRAVHFLEAIVAAMQTQAGTFVDLLGQGRNTRARSPLVAPGASKHASAPEAKESAPSVPSSCLRSLRAGAQSLWIACQLGLENAYKLCGLDVFLLSLVTVALVSSNMLSLAYVLFLGLGMWLRGKKLRVACNIITFFLALAVIFQYVVLIPIPHVNTSAHGSAPDPAPSSTDTAMAAAHNPSSAWAPGMEHISESLGLRSLAAHHVSSFVSQNTFDLSDFSVGNHTAGGASAPGSAPGHGKAHSASEDTSEDTAWQTWLALTPDVLAVAFVTVAYLLCAMQMNYLAWVGPGLPGQAAGASAASRHERDSLREPLLPPLMAGVGVDGASVGENASATSAVSADVTAPLSATQTNSECIITIDSVTAGESIQVRLVPKFPQPVWAPVTLAAMPTWLWHDWLRHVLFRHSLDVFMIVVVLLCCVDRDLIHAGYFALALYFFRKRDALRTQGNRIFFWLPLMNWTVILVSLAYQAPLQVLGEDEDGATCSVARVVGLFRFDESDGNSAFSLSSRGAASHLLMWLAMQVQSSLLETRAFKDTVTLLHAQQDEAREQVLRRRRAGLVQEAQICLEASRLRVARSLRISRLKASILESGGQLGADPGLLDASLLGSSSASGRETKHTPPPPPETPHSTTSSTSSALDSRAQTPTLAAISHNRTASLSRLTARPSWPHFLWSSLTQSRDLAAHVYVAYMAIFVFDFSLLTLPFPISALLYSLPADPHPFYWKLMLVYSEGLLVLQYMFQIGLQMGCTQYFVQDQYQPLLKKIGLHADLVWCMPLFVAYLVTLMHSYFLGLLEPRHRPSAVDSPMASSAQSDQRVSLRPWPSSTVFWFCNLLTSASQAAGRFLLGMYTLARRCCSSSSAEPHFVLLTLEANEALQKLGSGSKARLRAALQAALDDLAMHDLALRAAERASSPDAEIWRALGSNDPSLATVLHSQGSRHGLAPVAASRSIVDLSRTARLCVDVFDMIHSQPSQDVQVLLQVHSMPRKAQHQWQLSAGLLSWAEWPPPSLQPGDDVARALRRLCWLQATSDLPPGDLPPAPLEDVSQPLVGPHAARDFFRSDSGRGGGAGTPHVASASWSFEKAASKASQEAESLQTAFVTERRQRQSVQPATPQDLDTSAARTLDFSLLESVPSTSMQALGERYSNASDASLDLLAQHGLEGIHIRQVESHTKAVPDWYATSLLFNSLAFVYFAIFCQTVISSVESMSDLGYEHVVPTSFLIVLIAIFFNIVVDRVCYSLGSNAAKALLHVAEVGLYMYFSTTAFWTASILTTSKWHIRGFMLLRLVPMSLSALQIKSSYPPATVLASSRAADLMGGGRQDFYFYRHVDSLHYLLFQGFRAVPFLYELKAVLDWSCTASSLNLYDWLKLEDIRASLYNRQCDLHMRSRHRPGEKQPPMDKLLQGSLLFVALILLLWVPLLVFSTNNPTFQIPSLSAFTVNITLVSTFDAEGVHSSMRTQLYSSGMEHSRQEWLRPGHNLPRSLVTLGYESSQLQLQCTSPDSDTYWQLTPPLHAHWVSVLDQIGATSQRGSLTSARNETRIEQDVSAPRSLDARARVHDAVETGRVMVEVSWSTMRSFPPESAYGGPLCAGTSIVQLSSDSLHALSRVLRGELDWAPLQGSRVSTLWSNGLRDESASTSGLYNLVWRLKGHKCSASPMLSNASWDAGLHADNWTEHDWAAYQVGCDIGLKHNDTHSGRWWKLRCSFLDSNGSALPSSAAQTGSDSLSAHHNATSYVFGTSCPLPVAAAAASQDAASADVADLTWGMGPGVVAIVERVQSGLLGETLSSYGITGLYGLLVFGVARFLRLSVANMRLRIQYEDLPNVAQLCVLCNDISIARAEGELLLEEQLYYSLINIYRSPSVLFELTKKSKLQ